MPYALDLFRWNLFMLVINYFETRCDVDMSRLALQGISFSGTLTPLASVHEHPFTAILAIDGIYKFPLYSTSFSLVWTFS